MNIPLLSFKQLVTLFTSLGPHKHRELSRFAGVSSDIVAQWAQGIARPDPASERRHRHYLLSKLSDVKQLRADHDAQKEDLKRAEATVDRAALFADPSFYPFVLQHSRFMSASRANHRHTCDPHSSLGPRSLNRAAKPSMRASPCSPSDQAAAAWCKQPTVIRCDYAKLRSCDLHDRPRWRLRDRTV